MCFIFFYNKIFSYEIIKIIITSLNIFIIYISKTKWNYGTSHL